MANATKLEKMKFILVGAGGFGEFWQKLFIPRMKEFAVPVAAVDVSEEALQCPVRNGTLDASKCYTDIETAIAENPCDFLVLVIPPQHRMQYIDVAIKHGLHVVCEKPMADTMENACLIYNKMKKAGLKVSVTVSHRMEQNKQSLNRLLDESRYGKLNYIIGRLTMKRDFSRRGADRTFEEMVKGSIPGGLLHELDTCRGLSRSNAKSVYASMWRFEPGDGSLGSSMFATVEMENGVRCFIEHSHANATELNGWAREFYRAECANGTVVIDKDTLTADCDLGFPNPTHADLPLDTDSELWDHAKIVHDFCAWVQGGPEPETSIRDNMYCCALTFAAVESALSGQTVDVPAFLAKYEKQYQLNLAE
ncbi:Gfo/Idh/MocA family oxidoreductase [Ruminococcaceae bacterium OttesenSCG-928-L11]|nr:Gfo/Idh/MocA family oxidoreductase [Ruminococcaceae bacterium OttesenSCG-928-L11]